MKKYLYIAAAAAVAALSSCIKETFPSDYVLDSQISESESALSGMMNSIYTTLVGYENDDVSVELESYADLRVMLEHGTSALVCTGINGYNTMGAFCNGNFTNSNRGTLPPDMYYGYIKAVNDVIRLIDPDTTVDEEKYYLGQCLAFRAMFYMEIAQIMEYITPTDPVIAPLCNQPENDLTNLGVPIVTETTTGEEATDNPRPTVDENYDLVLSDLAKAETLLASFTRTDKIQPDLSVVYGLYARAYLDLASRVGRAAKYKDEAAYWKNAYDYADKAITQSGCTPLTEDQWTDPVNGFNNRTSQNSWLLATSISESNTYAAGGGLWGSFSFPMIMGTETDFEWYGWVVGRSLARHWYERLSDDDWRKQSWLGPEFFYKSTNQIDGEPYLVERDSSGNFRNNKYLNASAEGNNASDVESDWSDTFDGRLSNGTQYRLTSHPAWIRSRINKAYGYQSWPWLYVGIKFRPHNGEYMVWQTGGAVDYPVMRVEEMHFIKAEAAAHTEGVERANALLESIVQTRNSTYTSEAATLEEFLNEYYFQKTIEFWGEGIPYFDSKRLARGVYRAYLGSNIERFQHSINCSGVFPGWTPRFHSKEKNGNMAIYHYDTPAPVISNYYTYKTNDEFRPSYGIALDLDALPY